MEEFKPDKRKAIAKGLRSGAFALAKESVGPLSKCAAQIPGLDKVIEYVFSAIEEGEKAYHAEIDLQSLEHFKENVREAFRSVQEKINLLSANLGKINEQMAESGKSHIDKRRFVQQLLNPENIEKQQCIIQAYISSFFDSFDKYEQDKFFHMLNRLSMADLHVLAELVKQRKKAVMTSPVWSTLSRDVGLLCQGGNPPLKDWNPDLVQSCLTEVKNIGILSVYPGYGPRTMTSSGPVSSVDAYYINEFCLKFVNFVTAGTFLE